MSAEKGGALVRSPPGLISGVDAYSPHITTHNTWDLQQSPPGVPIQKQRSAMVTKISSDGRSSVSSKNSCNKQSRRQRGLTSSDVSGDEDLEEPCTCDSWARARQLQHDMEQLRRIHDSILKGLHQQLEEMKQKNRDLTFQLLMGPYASTVTISALSPDSDEISLKDDKNNLVKEEGDDLSVHKSEWRSENRDKAGDPRQVRSLNVEILEEETKELKKQLVEERAKNQYLHNVTEELKRQIRDDTGSWQPLQPAIKQPLPVVKSEDLKSTDNNIKETERQPPVTQEMTNMLHDGQINHQNRPQHQHQGNQKTRKKHEKNSILPSIGQSSTTAVRNEDPLNLKEEESIDYGISNSKDEQLPHKLKHKGKGKQLPNSSKNIIQGNDIKLNPRAVIGNTKSQMSYNPNQSMNNNATRDSDAEDSRSYHQNRGKRQETQNDVRHQSPRTSPGSLTRARAPSKGRISISSRESSITGRKTSKSPSVIEKLNITTKPARNESPTTSNKENRSKNSKSKAISSVQAGDSSTHQYNAPAPIGSSTSSVGSLASSSGGKTKHKSRTHRRKNKKKDNHEARNEPKDQ